MTLHRPCSNVVCYFYFVALSMLSVLCRRMYDVYVEPCTAGEVPGPRSSQSKL